MSNVLWGPHKREAGGQESERGGTVLLTLKMGRGYGMSAGGPEAGQGKGMIVP